jgi:glucan phosphoethanolaminetransferase (alkaline phosphatase superfamily)
MIIFTERNILKKIVGSFSLLFLLFGISAFVSLFWVIFLKLNTGYVVNHIVWVALLHTLVWSFFYNYSTKVVYFFYIILLILFYGLVSFSFIQWGDVITLKITTTYLSDLPAFLKSIHVHPITAIAIILGVIAVSFLLLKTTSFFTSAFRINQKFLWILFFITLITLISTKRYFHKNNEPTLVFLFDKMWGLQDNPYMNKHRTIIGKSDIELFENFTINSTPTKNVVLIVCDALRADHLSMYGYNYITTPFLDSLFKANKLTAINNCLSTSASTTVGIPSLLLSRRWKDCDINGFNLIKLLKKAGYNTHAIVSGAHKEWYNLAKFYTDDCDTYFDGKNSSQYYFKDDRVILEGLDRSLSKTKQPFFYYLHIQSPHETALLLDQFTIIKTSTNKRIADYDSKILQADFIIKSVFKKLVETNQLQNTIVVITADHGDGLGEHAVNGHVDWLYKPQIHIPFLIFGADTLLNNTSSFALQLDIAPTIVDLLNIQIPSSWQGESLIKGRKNKFAYIETGKNNLETKTRKYAFIADKDTALYKYIFTYDFSSEELYNLTIDPNETTNIYVPNSAIASDLKRHIQSNFKQYYDVD